MEKNPVRSAAIAAMWARRKAQPEVMEAHRAKLSASRKAKFENDPEFAAKQAEASAETLRRLRSDPAFRVRQSQRSTAVLTTLWSDPSFRERATARNIERYMRGLGLAAEATVARKREAAKWIMTNCAAELRENAECRALLSAAHNRLRREIPYDGPSDSSTYADYLSKLGTAVQRDPEVRRFKDAFMAEAIPRWANAWSATPDTSAR